MIPVPYISQVTGAPRRNDCGPACALMLARWVGHGQTETVTSLSLRFDTAQDGTTAANLQAALVYMGLTPVPGETGYPRIQLVVYSRLPKRHDLSYSGLHWIVRLDDTHYHDPYWPGEAGANIETTKAVLDAAESTAYGATAVRLGILERPMTPPVSTILREPYGKTYHVCINGTQAQRDSVYALASKLGHSATCSADDGALVLLQNTPTGVTEFALRTIYFYGVAADQQAAFRNFVAGAYPGSTAPVIEFRAWPGTAKPAIIMTAAPTTITSGQSSTVMWDAPQASSATLNGTSVATTQSTTVKPVTNTTYTLVATYNDATTQTKTVVVAVTPIVTTPTGSNKLGVNGIANHQILASYGSSGCRAFQVMDNVDVCNQLVNLPNAIVVSRHYVPNHFDGAQLAAHALFGNPDKRVILELLNEQDQGYNYGTPEELNARLDIELDAANRLLSQGYRVCLGGYSMGCPEVVGDRGALICDILRRRVAPLYNSNPNVYFSMHLYSPKVEHIGLRGMVFVHNDLVTQETMAAYKPVEVIVGKDSHVATVGVRKPVEALMGARAIPVVIPEVAWFETRWWFMFWACGFDPLARDTQGRGKVWCSETGVDEGGVGGFPAHSYSIEQYRWWCVQWLTLQGQDIVVDGKTYKSPFLGGAIYQVGNNTDWKGYNVEGYIPAAYQAMGWQ